MVNTGGLWICSNDLTDELSLRYILPVLGRYLLFESTFPAVICDIYYLSIEWLVYYGETVANIKHLQMYGDFTAQRGILFTNDMVHTVLQK